MKYLFATTLFFGMAMSLGLQVEIYDTAGCDLDAEMIGLVWYPAAYGIVSPKLQIYFPNSIWPD
jgi:hypothetical protein